MTDQPEHLHAVRFPGESQEYRQARDALLRVEKDVRDHTEQLTAHRPYCDKANRLFLLVMLRTRHGCRSGSTFCDAVEDVTAKAVSSGE